MSLITWVKPNGNEIKTNDEETTIVYAESLGWKRKGKKRGRPPNESVNDNSK